MLLSVASVLLPVLIFSGILFVLMLACIAIFPLFFSHFGDKNSNKLIVVAILSIRIIVYLSMSGDSGKFQFNIKKEPSQLRFMALFLA